MPTPRRAALAALVLAGLLGACAGRPAPSPPSVPPPGSPTAPPPTSPDRQLVDLPAITLPGMVDPPPGLGQERYTSQRVEWRPCERGLDCADVVAPLDHAAPDGQAITLRLTRRPGQSGRGRALLVNPGGPGEPAAGLVASRRWAALPGWDVVGWDPRGTGASTPVVCYDDPERPTPALDELLAQDLSPDDDAEYEALRQAQAAFARSCGQHSGRYLAHLSTLDTVADMELVRQLLGQERLNYLGYSYGTWLGAVYATRHPDRVGRMVLDSPVNVTQDESIGQAQGFDRAFGLFAQWSARHGGRLGRTADQVTERVRGLYDALDAAPLPVDDRELTQSLAVLGTAALLYGAEDDWRELERVLLDAVNRREGRGLLQLADVMTDRTPQGGHGIRYFSFPALLCADQPDRGWAAAREAWAVDRVRAPLFGYYFGPAVTCEQWVVPPVDPVSVTAPTAPPIVVVGSTGDAATPFEYAGWMAEALGSGVLLTWDGPGHGNYGGGNACLDGAVSAYLTHGTVPPQGAVCRP